MSKKVLAAVLVLANVMTLASCSQASNTDETTRRSRRDAEDAQEAEETEDEDKGARHSSAEDKVYHTIEKLGSALAGCDYDAVCELCSYEPYEIRSVMPVVYEVEEINYNSDFIKKKPGDMLRVRSVIAATTTYEIDESSFKSNLWAENCSVNVTFSHKDYNEILDKRDRFLGAADFNMLLSEVEDTVDLEMTLEFIKDEDSGRYLLANGRDLAEIYDYDLPELKFMTDIFDTVEDSWMTGPGWNSATETYTDTNTFEYVVSLTDEASQYVWQYKYRISRKTDEGWVPLYTSDTIVDRYPTGIDLVYTEQENFPTGHYIFFIYDMQSGSYYGWEYDVVNSAEVVQTDNAVTGSVAETEAPQETEEADEDEV